MVTFLTLKGTEETSMSTKKKTSIIITIVIIAALAVGLRMLPEVLHSSNRTENTGSVESQINLSSLAEGEESWAQEREQEQSLAEEKQAEKPTIAGGNGWLVLNPKSFFTLNEEVTGWHGGITWKVTDVALVDSLPDYPSAKYTEADKLFFLNEAGGLAVESMSYTRNYIAEDGAAGKETEEAELAILLVELEVSSALSYEFDFEYPLRIEWFEEKEGQVCCTFVNGMFDREWINLYGPWTGGGIPFYISVADQNGFEGDPSRFLFYKLQPGETIRYQAAFLVDRNTLYSTWLRRIRDMTQYLYYDEKPCFLPVGQLLSAGEEVG